MYYLIFKDIENNVKFVSNCKKSGSRMTILYNHCRCSNINMVERRKDVTDKCVGESLYCYRLSDNKYIVLDCKEHPQNIFFNRYVEKHTIGFLEFIYYVNSRMPLATLKAKPENYCKDNEDDKKNEE